MQSICIHSHIHHSWSCCTLCVRKGLTLVSELKAGSDYAFIARNASAIIVVFRGTCVHHRELELGPHSMIVPLGDPRLVVAWSRTPLAHRLVDIWSTSTLHYTSHAGVAASLSQLHTRCQPFAPAFRRPVLVWCFVSHFLLTTSYFLLPTSYFCFPCYTCYTTSWPVAGSCLTYCLTHACLARSDLW